MNWILMVGIMYHGQYQLIQTPGLTLQACKLLGHEYLVNSEDKVKDEFKVGLPLCFNRLTGESYGASWWELNQETRIWFPHKDRIEREQVDSLEHIGLTETYFGAAFAVDDYI